MRDYLAEMLNALTSAYSRKDYDNLLRASPVETLIGKLFSVLAWGLNTVQEQAELIRLWDDIDNARGSVLDRYGANFGVKRFGATDNFYRLAIKVKLLAQLSGGDINTVLDAAASLFEIPVERIDMDEVFPDKISLNINEADLTPETLAIVADIVTMIKRILASGIGMIATLRSYREFRNEVLIGTSLFDHTKLTFDLPDVRRAFTEEVRVESAAFERSSLVFDLPDVRRCFRAEDVLASAAAFEHTGLIFNLPAPAPKTFSQVAGVKPVLFEHTRLKVPPAVSPPRVFQSVCPAASVLFERSQVTIKPTY